MISPFLQFAALKVRDREGCAALTSSLCVFSVHIFCHELHVLAEPGIAPFCVWVLKKKKKKKYQKKLLAVDISSGRRQIEVAILSVDSVYDLNLSRLLKKKKKKKKKKKNVCYSFRF